MCFKTTTRFYIAVYTNTPLGLINNEARTRKKKKRKDDPGFVHVIAKIAKETHMRESHEYNVS
jgi:hypothetical protein